MSNWQIAVRSFIFYLRQNLVVAIGVAVATAVLTGALIVGDSVRTSLRELALDRLGDIDELIVSDGFFREQLATELAATDSFKANYSQAIPMILFPNGTVEYRNANGAVSRVTNVNVLGIKEEFWSLSSLAITNEQKPFDSNVVINQVLADELGNDVEPMNSSLTLRVPKPTQLPNDSPLGKTNDLVESLVDLKIVHVVPNKSLGRFGLHPSQTDTPNIYVPIELLQDALSRSALEHKQELTFANVILLQGKDDHVPATKTTNELLASMRPSLEDFGLILKRVKQDYDGKIAFDYISLSSDRLVLPDAAVSAAQEALPASKPVFTYLANDIRKPEMNSGVPFSMIASIDVDDSFRPKSVTGEPISNIGANEVVINEWTANDLQAKIGDELVVTYFEPETTHGNQVESTATLKVIGIVPITEPFEPFQVRRRGRVVPAVFDALPTLVNDPDLTPEVPGVTDAETIESWDLPFETKDKLRPQDNDYWSNYRTTPKAFVSVETGRRLWGSRFGNTTSMRIPATAGTVEEIDQKLTSQLSARQEKLGFQIIPIKRNGLKASAGSTPFDVLFLALSMFVIASALILVSLLFRLGLQNRANEVGAMQAIGFSQQDIVKVWLREMLFVCAIGALLGTLLGIGYAAVMVLGLKTWWVGAISNPFLTLHIGPLSLIIGLLSGMAVCVMTIWWSLRRTRKQSVRGLLSGELESNDASEVSQRGYLFWLACVLVFGAVGLSFSATGLAGDAQSGAFMGSGFLILTALLMLIYRWLCKSPALQQITKLDLNQLAGLSAKRNPLRSTLTIGLVAVASFLIVAVSSFRLSPTEAGTAGFDLVAESSQAIFGDLNTKEGQRELLGDARLPVGTDVFSMRVKPGQDASCNNLYQSTQPRVLGVSERFVERFEDDERPAFAWGASEANDELTRLNPWRLLNEETDDDAIPVIIDKNTANYSLKIFATGGDYKVVYDSGETVTFRVVGFLSNTILQGSLIVSEENFKRAFPGISGYRFFLIDEADVANSLKAADDSVASVLESQMGDEGFDSRSAVDVLSAFMQVQNTYLSTFQTLGGLGLLLGTIGLAVVQFRNVIERRREFGLMRAVGFAQSKLARLVLFENASLLLFGLGVGIVSAVFATLPHYLIGSASIPWVPLAVMLGAIAVVGLLSGRLASGLISRIPLLESLR